MCVELSPRQFGSRSLGRAIRGETARPNDNVSSSSSSLSFSFLIDGEREERKKGRKNLSVAFRIAIRQTLHETGTVSSSSLRFADLRIRNGSFISARNDYRILSRLLVSMSPRFTFRFPFVPFALVLGASLLPAGFSFSVLLHLLALKRKATTKPLVSRVLDRTERAGKDAA